MMEVVFVFPGRGEENRKKRFDLTCEAKAAKIQ